MFSENTCDICLTLYFGGGFFGKRFNSLMIFFLCQNKFYSAFDKYGNSSITNPENSIFLAICSVTFALYFIGRDQLYCGPHEFMCLHAQKCIPIQLRCDRENDCNDWEDEINCTGYKLFVINEVVS